METETIWRSLFNCQGVLHNPLPPCVLRYKVVSNLKKKKQHNIKVNYYISEDNMRTLACFLF